MDKPFLAHLGVPPGLAALPPTADGFPMKFNPDNREIWEAAIDGLEPQADASLAWTSAIEAYVEGCERAGVYPFTTSLQALNDQIFSALQACRRDLVHYLNKSQLLKKLMIRTTDRSVQMTVDGFVLTGHANVRLKDPTIPDWLRGQGFKVINHELVRHIGHNCVLRLGNKHGVMVDRWELSYSIEVPLFPDIPGNGAPSKAELENFILKTLWLPILRAHRPFGMVHKLI